MLTQHADNQSIEAALMVCFDFKKAFDKVSHHALLNMQFNSLLEVSRIFNYNSIRKGTWLVLSFYILIFSMWLVFCVFSISRDVRNDRFPFRRNKVHIYEAYIICWSKWVCPPNGFSKLMKSHLLDRYHLVRNNGVFSDIMHVSSGVQKGSLLGPYHFGIETVG